MSRRLLIVALPFIALACGDDSADSASPPAPGSDAAADAPDDIHPSDGGKDAADGPIWPDPEGGIDASDASEDPGSAIPPTGPAVLVWSHSIDDALEVKLPSIMADESRVILGGTSGESARVWTKPVFDELFGSAESIGDARGQPNYAATTLQLASDGVLHATWIDQTEPTSSIHYRAKSPGAAWGPVHTVVGGDGFRPFADVAPTSIGTMVAWDENERIRYSITADGGSSWSAPAVAVDASPGQVPSIATLPGGVPVIAHGWEDVFVEIWSGSAFSRETVPRPNPHDFYADPSVATTADGRILVASRMVEPGLMVGERDAAGSWTVTTPFADQALGHVSIEVDRFGGMHLAWASGDDPSGIRYAYRPAGSAWQAPVIAPIGHFHNGAWLAVSETEPMRVHIATEDFDDAGLRVRVCAFEVQ